MDLLPGFDVYKSHKFVGAMKIAFITQKYEGRSGFVVQDELSRTWLMTQEFMSRHKPEQGGYIVQYEDGYMSYSPQVAFEGGYTLIGTAGTELVRDLGYDAVIRGLKRRKMYARAGWNGADMFIFLVPGSTFRVNREPLLSILGLDTDVNYHAHIDMKTADGSIVTWLCSQTDAMAEDWFIVE